MQLTPVLGGREKSREMMPRRWTINPPDSTGDVSSGDYGVEAWRPFARITKPVPTTKTVPFSSSTTIGRTALRSSTLSTGIERQA